MKRKIIKVTIQRMLRRDSNEIVDHTKTHTDRDVILPSAAIQIIEECRRYQKEHGWALVEQTDLWANPFLQMCGCLSVVYKLQTTQTASSVENIIFANSLRRIYNGGGGWSHETEDNQRLFDKDLCKEQ